MAYRHRRPPRPLYRAVPARAVEPESPAGGRSVYRLRWPAPPPRRRDWSVPVALLEGAAETAAVVLQPTGFWGPI